MKMMRSLVISLATDPDDPAVSPIGSWAGSFQVSELFIRNELGRAIEAG